eukprot:scaffold41253_cov57-Phaeocystis_antarctica.AAC.2
MSALPAVRPARSTSSGASSATTVGCAACEASARSGRACTRNSWAEHARSVLRAPSRSVTCTPPAPRHWVSSAANASAAESFTAADVDAVPAPRPPPCLAEARWFAARPVTAEVKSSISRISSKAAWFGSVGAYGHGRGR